MEGWIKFFSKINVRIEIPMKNARNARTVSTSGSNGSNVSHNVHEEGSKPIIVRRIRGCAKATDDILENWGLHKLLGYKYTSGEILLELQEFMDRIV